MEITVNGVVSTIIDIFALYIASLLLKCSDIKKWVIWIYIVLRVLDLFSSLYQFFYPIKSDANNTSSHQITSTAEFSAIGFFIVVLLFLSVTIFIMDLYVLYKMYKCDTVPKHIFWIFVITCIVGSLVKVFVK